MKRPFERFFSLFFHVFFTLQFYPRYFPVSNLFISLFSFRLQGLRFFQLSEYCLCCFIAALSVGAHAVDRRIGREGRLEVVRIVVAILDAAHHPRADGHRGLTGDEHALLGELLRHAVGVRWRGMIHVHHVVDQLNRRHVDRIVDVRGAVRMVERVAAERLHGEVVERVRSVCVATMKACSP